MTTSHDTGPKKKPAEPDSANRTEAGQLAESTQGDFLNENSGAVTGTVLPSPRVMPAADTSPKKVRMGVVGGGFGPVFPWHLHPGCIVEAVSDIQDDRREHLMNKYQCKKSYNSLEELLKDKNIDAVAVFTEGPNHVRHTIECMKHGKHVICAVPACLGGGIEEAEELLDAVKRYGLTYMMAETSYYRQSTISARKFYKEGKFGEIYYAEAEYQHTGLEHLYFSDGKRTWRYGVAPMHYPTHCTSFLIGVTGERLTEVVCHGWGDDSPYLKDNVYNNPFWNESAMFKTDRGHAFRANVWWKGAHRGCERAQWIGSKMSFYDHTANDMGPVIVRAGKQQEEDDAGFVRDLPEFEHYEQTQWWQTDILPEPLRHDSGHGCSHNFITHEFIDALTHDRRPAIDVYEALAYTVPGIIAHESALRGGKLLKIPQFDPPTNHRVP